MIFQLRDSIFHKQKWKYAKLFCHQKLQATQPVVKSAEVGLKSNVNNQGCASNEGRMRTHLQFFKHTIFYFTRKIEYKLAQFFIKRYKQRAVTSAVNGPNQIISHPEKSLHRVTQGKHLQIFKTNSESSEQFAKKTTHWPMTSLKQRL